MKDHKQVATLPLALVGMGCRFPGGCQDVESFWAMLKEGRSGITEVPPDRWSNDRFYHSDTGVAGRMNSKRGGFVNHLKDFDPKFWGISPREAIRVDPQQRWLLETTWEAIEDAGIAPTHLRGKSVGVFVGISTHDYGSIQHDDISRHDVHTNSGGTLSIASNRISYLFDFKGPSVSVDTACSSSLVAVSLAAKAIWTGECEAALAGGVNAIITPHASIGFAKASMLSPTGECFAFDQRANGYVRGEGAGVVFLKPLDKALEDGNPIYAVLRSAVVNQDGHTSSMTVPGVEGQSEMLRRAYEMAGIEPRQVVYVEAHGTGTPVGDPIETKALGNVLSQGRDDDDKCLIGSVKTNIGHLESGSGIAGLIKGTLVLDRDMIPPSLNFETPNSNIPFDKLKLKVASQQQPLPHRNGHAPLVGINSFGFGGTNAHVVLEAAPKRVPMKMATRKIERADRCFVLPISARDENSLRQYVQAYRDELKNGSLDLANFCYSAGQHKDHHNHRLVVMGNNARQLRDRLNAWLRNAEQPGVVSDEAKDTPGKMAFVFSGQGIQSWAMGRDLIKREPSVRRSIEEVDQLFVPLSGWSILDEMTKLESESNIHRTSIAQPAIFALQVALARLWNSWGIEPNCVIGHSVGEVAAAYCAGCLTLEDATHLIYHRSRLQDSVGSKGRMLVAGISALQATERIAELAAHVQVTAINSPNLVTLGGDREPLEMIAAKLEDDGLFTRWLPIDYAFHTHHMDPIRDELESSLAKLQPRTAEIPFVSTVLGEVLPGENLDAKYWWQNVRMPVQFAPAIDRMIEGDVTHFLEIGSHPAMQSSIRECLAEQNKPGDVFASLHRDHDDTLHILTNLAELHLNGIQINWGAVNQSAGNFIRQPSYPWNYETCWLDEGEMSSRLEVPSHPLLFERVVAAKPTWQFALDPRLFPFLNDHRIWNDIVFPAAGYAEIGLAVASEVFAGEDYAVEDVESLKALFTSEETVPQVQVVFDESTKSYAVYSSTDLKNWDLNARGKLVQRSARTVSTCDLAALRGELPEEIDHAVLYEQLRWLGYGFGPNFSQIQHVWRTHGQSLVEIVVPDEVAQGYNDYRFHPAVLDACFHATFGAWDLDAHQHSAKYFYLPEFVGRVQLHCEQLPTRIWAHARQKQNDGKTIICDICVYDETGTHVADIVGFRLGRVEHKPDADDVENNLYEFNWLTKRLRGSALEGTCQFPTTGRLVEQLDKQTVYDELRLAEYYREFVPRLAQLTFQSIQNAFVEMGWPYKSGERFTTDELVESLGIVEEHHRLAHAELHWLCEAGLLQRDEANWRVLECPRFEDVLERLTALGDEFPRFATEVALHQATSPHLAKILLGETDPLDLLFPAGSNKLLEAFYVNGGDLPAFHRLIKQVVAEATNSLPGRRAIRVLEIGGGTGSMTREAIEALPTDRAEYLFTDIGTTFVNAARSQFANCEFMDFQTFDVERDLDSQNINENGYDLILATDVLHATADLQQSVRNIKKCLAPGGLLVFLELVTPCARLDNIFGLLKGWWRFTDEETRTESPLVSQSSWKKLLTECGFGDVRSFNCSPDATEIIQSVFVATNPSVEPRPKKDRESDTTLVFVDDQQVGSQLAAELQAQGGATIQLRLGNDFRRVNECEFELTTGSADEIRRVFEEAVSEETTIDRIVHCWSLDQPDAISMTPDLLVESQQRGVLSGLNLAKALSTHEFAKPPRVYFVTRAAQSVTENDAVQGLCSSALTGLTRVANNEQDSFRWTLIDLSFEPDEYEILNLADEILRDDAENEVAYRNGQRHVHRLQPLLLDNVEERSWKTDDENNEVVSFRLETCKPGTLENLSFNQTPRKTPGPNEIEIRVQAGGINFRDVMKALGMYPGNPVDLLWFGDDFSGIVERVGDEVEDLAVGDRVVGLAPYCFRSHVTIDRRMTFKVPEEMAFEEAATLPTVFLTSHYAINHLARMQAGEKILIHAGTGGVGQSAIQIAQHAGLEIFATAGTTEKRQMLKDMGVPHVMDSRSLEFADEIMSITKGEGVDAVLNSLAGEFIPKSLSVLAPFGRFLEIGKIDVWGNSKLGLSALKENVSYHVIDLGQVILDKPLRVKAMFEELKPHFDAGTYRPLTHKVFPVSKVVDAFRYMAQGKHVGKNVLSFGDDAISVGPCSQEGHLFKRDASYLITGGAGGFGLEVAKWMASQGAGHLHLMSRSGPNEEAQADIEKLREAGVGVYDVRGDVTSEADVTRIVEQIQVEHPQLRGVIHGAMVLHDEDLTTLDEEMFHRVLNPKIVGAWNLHTATLELALDHFICFSSISAVFGAPRQANYNAGNCFLDTLARHRQALGIAGLTVNWGVIQGAGFVDRNQKTADYLAGIGLAPLRFEEALSMLGVLIRHHAPQVAVARVDWQRLRKLSPAIANLPTYHDVAAESAKRTSGATLQSRLAGVSSDEHAMIVEDFLVGHIASVFGIQASKIDGAESLSKLGLDSLMAVELMNRIEAEAGLTISMGNVLSGPSVQQLARLILDRLGVVSVETSDETADSDEVEFEREAQLDAEITTADNPPIAIPENPRIFLTGATGFIGAFLLTELLERTSSEIVCLVRASDEAEALERIKNNLVKYESLDEKWNSRIHVLAGDLAEPHFGLEQTAFDQLAEGVDVIYHNAASVNLALPYASLRGTNVDGTREVLRLACQAKTKPLHMVSTFTVHTTDSNRGETVLESDPLPPCDELLYGYSQTKWVSEKMIDEAKSRGLPVAIYRPGHVVGDSQTGISNTGDLLHSLVLTCIRVGAAPRRNADLDITPVNYVASAIADLSLRSDSIGKTFHLTNPNPLRFMALMEWVEGLGLGVNFITDHQWRNLLMSFAEQAGSQADELRILADILAPRALAVGDANALHPVFDCSGATAALSSSDIRCAAADETLLQTCFDYLQKTGVVGTNFSQAHVV